MHPTRSLPVPILLAGLAATALGGVDLEVDPRAKVKGTFDAPDEVETFRFEAPVGATVSVAVVAKGRAPLDLDLTLSRPSGPAVDLSGAPVFKDVGKKVLVKKLELPESGAYTLEVRGAGVGEYQLKLAVAPRRKWSGTTAPLDADTSVAIAFGAQRGSRLALKAKPAKGSPAVARWEAFELLDLSASGKVKPTSHNTAVEDTGGELSVDATLFNRGTMAGAIAWTLVVKPPRSKPQKLDVRGAVLGGAQNGGTAVSRTVPADTGATVAVDDEDSDLDGAAIVVPGGALTEDVRITITSADDVGPPDPDTQLAVGAPFVLGPEGLTFSQGVDVWVPFDPAKLPAGVDASQLLVRKVSASGTSLELPVLEVDGDRVRVQVTSFSSFVPFVAKGTPRLEGASFWDLFVELEAFPDGSGMDSRGRAVFLGLASITFGAENQPGGFGLTLEDREYAFSHGDQGVGTLNRNTTTGTETLTWRYGASGQSVIVEEGPGEETEWLLNADGTLLTIDDGANDDPLAAFDIMLRKPARAPTTASLAGKYWYAEFGLEAAPTGSGPLFLDAYRGFGEVTLRADGTLGLSGRFTEQYFHAPSGAYIKETSNGSSGGTFSVQDGGVWDGTVEMTLPWDEPQNPDVLRFFPEAGGRILVGTDKDATSDEFLFIVLIRQGAGMQLADVAGPRRSIGMEYEPTVYSVPTMGGPVPVPDFSAWSTFEDLTFDDGRILTPGIFFHGWERDQSLPGGLSVTNVQESSEGPIPFSLRSTGRWSIGKSSKSEEVVGAFSPDGSFGIYTFSPDGPDDLFGMGLFFEQPPARP